MNAPTFRLFEFFAGWEPTIRFGVQRSVEDSQSYRSSAIGYAAILAGLSLNVFFWQLAGTSLDLTRLPFRSFIAAVGIAAFLTFGLFWAPAAQCLRGVPLSAQLEQLFGRRAGWLLQKIVFPVALFYWFSSMFNASFWTLEGVLHLMDVHDGSVWRDSAVRACGVGVLIYLGVRGSIREFARSSIWLDKIAIIVLAGLLVANTDGIVDGIARLQSNRKYVSLNFGEFFGTAIEWYAAPILVLAGSLQDVRVRSADTRKWLLLAGGVGAGLIAALTLILCDVVFLGVLGKVPKVLGFVAALGQGSDHLVAGKMIVALLTVLVALRLGPRLILSLWSIPAKSWRACLAVGLLISAAIPLDGWSSPDHIVLAMIPVAAVGGAMASTELLRAYRGHGAAAMADGSARLRLASLMIGIFIPLVLATAFFDLETASNSLASGKFTEAGWLLLSGLYDLKNFWANLYGTANAGDFSMLVWAWILSFLATLLGGLATARRHRDATVPSVP